MKLAELVPKDALRPGTQAFVAANAAALAHKLARPLEVLERKMRNLRGGDGLLLKKRYLEADEAWAKFYWTRIAEHHLAAKLPLERAMELADEDVAMLSSILSPL